MNSRVSWSVDGIDPSVRERAEAAARRAGMTLNDWLNSSIGEPAPPNFRAPHDQRPAMPSQEIREVADIHQRLDSITRQIEQISRPAPRGEQAPRAEPGVARQLNDAISRLDARLSQISNPAPARHAEIQDKQRQAEMVERAAAQIYRPSPPLSPASMDFAVAEIAARQNELDGPSPRQAPSGQVPPRQAAPIGAGRPGLFVAGTSSGQDHEPDRGAAAPRSRRAVDRGLPQRTHRDPPRPHRGDAAPGDRIDRERNPHAVPSYRRHQAERQRRPGPRRHRARAWRNPRSAALADAGRTTGRL